MHKQDSDGWGPHKRCRALATMAALAFVALGATEVQSQAQFQPPAPVQAQVPVQAASQASKTSGATNVARGAGALTPDKEAPVVHISHLLAGSTVAGKQSIKVLVTDNAGGGDIKVSLSINHKMVAMAGGGELVYVWNTAKFAPGSYVISATARDLAGNQGSASVTVKR